MAKAKKEAPPIEPKAIPVIPKAKQAEPVEQIDGKTLKDCPRCGAPSTGTYIDKHGYIRCNCSHPKCGFWDSMVYRTPKEAAAGWQAAGGPNKD